MPVMVFPSNTGRCRNPWLIMSSVASPVSMSGLAVTGSPVIQSATRDEVRSARAAAARSTSRSVKIPIKVDPSITTADPNRPFSMLAATSATDVLGVVENTSDVMISFNVTMSAPHVSVSTALASDLVDPGVPGRRGGIGEIVVQLAPERASP